MGIVNPRPAMRAGEERRLRNTLQQHRELHEQIREAGVPNELASKIAFNIATTHAKRNKVWRTK